MSKIVSKEELSATVFKLNMALVVERLKELGCVSVCVEYSGEGDSGNMNDIFYTEGADMPNIDIKSTQRSSLACHFVQSKYNNETKDWDYVIEKNTNNLDSLVSALCDHCLAVSGHSGYENEDGGGGTFTIDVQTGLIQMEHYENIVQQEYFNFSVNPQTSEILYKASEEDAAAEAVPAAPSA